MRNGVGAGFPHHGRYPDVQALPSQGASHALVPYTPPVQQHAHRSYSQSYSAPQQPSPSREAVARLFRDLRAALRVTPHQIAAHLVTRSDTIAALEAGDFEHLPPWHETSRIVLAYTALAGIDGRPVLAAVADVVRRSPHAPLQLAAPVAKPAATPMQAPPQALPPERPRAANVSTFVRAGSAIANGAKRFPAGALKQVRQRPQRALYAVSLPLGLVMFMFNTSTLQAAFSNVPRPIARVAQDVRQYFQVQFAPVREGLRWIEVDDPRRRRADKLR